MKSPCKDCISYAICNSRKPETVQQFIIDNVFLIHCLPIYRYVRDEADPEKGLYQVINEPIELESVKEVARIFGYNPVVTPAIEVTYEDSM